MRVKIYCIQFVVIWLMSPKAWAQKNVFPIVADANNVSIIYDGHGTKLDSICANLLSEDIERVTSFKPNVSADISKAKGNVIVIGNIQSALIQKFYNKQSSPYKNLVNKWECFGLSIVDKPLSGISRALIVAGSDARGTAYGVFTLSEKIGVSPWYWWADVHPQKKTTAFSKYQLFYFIATFCKVSWHLYQR